MTVDRSPPESSALDAEQSEKSKEELNGTGGFVRFVTEVAMVDACDKKHPDDVESCADE